MRRSHGRPRATGGNVSASRARGRTARPALESLERRELLAHGGPTSRAILRSGGVIYTLAVSGPGVIAALPMGRGQVGIGLLGTTNQSQVIVAPKFVHNGFTGDVLQVSKIIVRSGELGAFIAPESVDLVGAMTPLKGPVQSLLFDSLGSGASIDVKGDLGQLGVAHDVVLGPTGQVQVEGALANPITIGGDLIAHGGQITVGGASTGGLQVGGNLQLDSGGKLHVTGDMAAPITINHDLILDGGQLAIDRDLTGPLSVAGNLVISNGGSLLVGRDLSGPVTISGDLIASSGGVFHVQRDFNSLAIAGNFDTSGGGQLLVDGSLALLTIQGYAQGARSKDIVIGVNLENLTVLGGGLDVGGLRSLELLVGKRIDSLNVAHGIFHSRISAGVSISGQPGASVGPDGPIAILDSLITAGVLIQDFYIDGDVVSDNPDQPTRIIAGVDLQGNFFPAGGGTIDRVQINGNLIDAVLAASVQPYGGNGTTSPGDSGHNTYDAPGGPVGPDNMPLFMPNYTAPPFDMTMDPTIDDLVLPRGSINPSYAPASPTDTATTPTIFGSVITTHPGNDSADFAGLFAANTRGVFVAGAVPRT